MHWWKFLLGFIHSSFLEPEICFLEKSQEWSLQVFIGERSEQRLRTTIKAGFRNLEQEFCKTQALEYSTWVKHRQNLSFTFQARTVKRVIFLMVPTVFVWQGRFPVSLPLKVGTQPSFIFLLPIMTRVCSSSPCLGLYILVQLFSDWPHVGIIRSYKEILIHVSFL